ncbi:MAG: PrsW family intramembrane metalloprotease [Chloroflexi bacterium]|nr:MAG: PrsW family intramembrane metalloprotease [Chloroflexota bacterium]
MSDVHEHVPKERGSVWQADVASIGILVLFVLLIYGIERFLQPTLGRSGLLVAGVIISIVPAFIWLAFFYRRDRLEPEPKHMVFQLFLLGALLANGIGIPLVDGWFDVPNWLSSSPVLAQLLGGWLIVGMVQEFLVYAAVRFTIYNHAEFDEETDGVVYATAAGIGFATVLNIAFVVNSGGVALGSGGIRIVLTTLAHAAFAGVIGYFLGRQKFEKRPLYWMPLGLMLAAGINSLFFYFRSMLSSGSIKVVGGAANPWLGLVLAIVLTGVVTALISRAIHNNVEEALAAVEEG